MIVEEILPLDYRPENAERLIRQQERERLIRNAGAMLSWYIKTFGDVAGRALFMETVRRG